MNLVMLKAQTDIFKRDRDSVIEYITEVNKRYYIDLDKIYRSYFELNHLILTAEHHMLFNKIYFREV